MFAFGISNQDSVQRAVQDGQGANQPLGRAFPQRVFPLSANDQDIPPYAEPPKDTERLAFPEVAEINNATPTLVTRDLHSGENPAQQAVLLEIDSSQASRAKSNQAPVSDIGGVRQAQLAAATDADVTGTGHRAQNRVEDMETKKLDRDLLSSDRPVQERSDENADNPAKSDQVAQDRPAPSTSQEPAKDSAPQSDPFGGVESSSPPTLPAVLSQERAVADSKINSSENRDSDSVSAAEGELTKLTPAPETKTSEAEVGSQATNASRPTGETESTTAKVAVSGLPDRADGLGFDPYRWIIPVLIFLALIVGFMFANRKKRRLTRTYIDPSKPVRGAFQKRSPAKEAQDSAHVDDAVKTSMDMKESSQSIDIGEFDLIESDSEPDFDKSNVSLRDSGNSAGGQTVDVETVTMKGETFAKGHYVDQSVSAGSLTTEFQSDNTVWLSSETSLPATASLSEQSTKGLVPDDQQMGLNPIKRWFGKAWPAKNSESFVDSDLNSREGELGSFQVADEDLRSLFAEDKEDSGEHVFSTRSEFSERAQFVDSDDTQEANVFGNHSQASGPTDTFLDSDDGFEFQFEDESIDGIAESDELASAEQKNIAELQSENERLTGLLAAATRDLEAFTAQQNHQLEEYRLEQTTLTVEMKAQRDLINRLQQELLQSSTAQEAARAKLDETTSLFEEREKRWGGQGRELEELQERVGQVQADLVATQKKEQSLRQELDQRKAELEAVDRLKTEASCQLLEVKAQTDSLQAEIKARQVQIEHLQAENEALKKQNLQVQSEQEDFGKRSEQLQQIQGILQAKNDELLAKLVSREESEAALGRRTAELQAELELSRQDIDRHGQRVHELEMQISEMASKSSSSSGHGAVEMVSQKTKEKFTRLFRSYERERKLRKEAEQFLTEAEEQISQYRIMLKQHRSEADS
jgi:hypothetical protein